MWAGERRPNNFSCIKNPPGARPTVLDFFGSELRRAGHFGDLFRVVADDTVNAEGD